MTKLEMTSGWTTLRVWAHNWSGWRKNPAGCTPSPTTTTKWDAALGFGVCISIHQRKSTMRRVCIPWTPFLSFFNSQHLLLFISQCLQLLSLFPIHSFIHSCAFLMCVYNTPEPLFSFTNLPEKWTNDNMHDGCGVKKQLDAAQHSWNCTTDEKEPTTICQISRLVGLNRETTWIK
jgi:hypothetical protein